MHPIVCVFCFIKLDFSKHSRNSVLKQWFGFLIQDDMSKMGWERSLFVATETQTHRDSTMWDPASHSNRKIELLMSQASN